MMSLYSRRWWLAGLFAVVALTGLAWPRPAQACQPLDRTPLLAWFESSLEVPAAPQVPGLVLAPVQSFQRYTYEIMPPAVLVENKAGDPIEVVAFAPGGETVGVTTTFRLQSSSVQLWQNDRWTPWPGTTSVEVPLSAPSVAPAPVLDRRMGEGRNGTAPATQTLSLALDRDGVRLAIPLTLTHQFNPRYDPALYASPPPCGWGGASRPHRWL